MRKPNGPTVKAVRRTLRQMLLAGLEWCLIIRTAWRTERLVALTFDDGPFAEDTLEVLAALQACDVTATFFLLGEQTQHHPDIVRALVDAGMEIGNHAMHHKPLRGKPLANQTLEIHESACIIAAAGGRPIGLFRPPFGDFDETTVAASSAAGQAIVLWNVDPREWSGIDAITTATRAIRSARTPAVILMHDDSPATPHAIPAIVRAYKRAGYRFVPVSQIPRGRWPRRTPQFADGYPGEDAVGM